MINHITPGVDALMMKTPEEIKRGLEIAKTNCLYVEGCEGICPYNKNCDVSDQDKMAEIPRAIVSDALAYIQQLERENAQKDERILQLGMINAEYKHVLGYIKHAADMGVHGDADVLAQFGINMGRGVEEEE